VPRGDCRNEESSGGAKEYEWVIDGWKQNWRGS
jgi:hypothetical protein